MSGVVKQRGTAPTAPSNKPPPPDTAKMAATSNGGSSAQYGTLSYPAEVTDDVNMNEVDGLVTLDVTLPNGNKMDISIDYNTPMLDLLVSLAGKSRLNPSGLALQLISEDTGKPLAYKPNQTIGALGGRVVHIVKKPDGPGKDKYNKGSKKKQPFEMTHRFTINLPRGQKAVLRVSPITSLGQLLSNVCQDKGLDPAKHVLQLPGQPGTAVDPSATVGRLGIFEMNLVNLALQDRRNQALSMPDLSQVPPRDDKIPTYMPGSGETKKKRGFFSFLTRKEKKFKLSESMQNIETSSTTSHMMSSAQSRRLPYQPHIRRGSDTGLENSRPKSMFVSAQAPMDIDDSRAPPQKENLQAQVTAPTRKKKRAPAPPVPDNIPPNKTQREQTVPSSESKAPKQEVQNGELHKEPVSDTSRVSPPNQKDVNSSSSSTSQSSSSRAEMLSRLHSRNSSDSSGYHELTLSGCESPEATHGVIKSKISLDSTSIESADNANGDSGIHESPIRVSPIEEVLEKGDVAVVASKPPATESAHHTLPSKKKKKAPAPPPLSTPRPGQPTEVSPSAPAPTQEEVKAEVEEVSIPQPQSVQKSADVTDATTHMPTATMKLNEDEEIPAEDPMMSEDTGFDINDILSSVNFEDEAAPFKPIVIHDKAQENGVGDDSMMMVETASVASENIEQIDMHSKSERPCAFIPPPPPTEPPPPDEPEIDYPDDDPSKPVFVDKGTGVNEDNASLAPTSAKNSPEIAQHRRMDSFSSVGSVDTIEGISLDFQMAIQMGQETLSPSVDDVEVSSSGFKSEMALFVERMSKMAVENPHGDSNHLNDSLSSSLSAPGSDTTNSDTGSVIRHLRSDSHDSRSGSDLGSPRNKDSKSVVKRPSVDNSKEMQMHTDFAVSEEISIPVETVPPPPEFDDEGGQRDDESDEEVVETVEEIIIPLGPDGYDFTSAKTISEMTTFKPKENGREGKPTNYGLFRAEPVSINPIEEPVSPPSSVPKTIPVSQLEMHAYKAPVNESAPVKHTMKPVSFTPVHVDNVQAKKSEPAQKEEFVLTTEDLSSVTFLPPQLKSPATKVHETDNQSTMLIMAKSDQKTYLNNFSNEDETESSSYTQNIQSRVSELSFTPRPESEADSLLEEKPIALLNMSSMKIAVEAESSSRSSSIDNKNSIQSYSPTNSELVNDTHFNHHYSPIDQDFTNSTVPISQSAPDAVEYSEDRPESRASATSFDLADQQDVLQAQYNSLQAQFGQWQEQLRLNQNMLSTDNSGEVQPEQLQQLASQMTMQQEMMMQLQSTMQALQLQQHMNGRNEHRASSVEVEQAAAAAESAFRPLTPPTPPAPPAAPTVGAGGDIQSQVQLKPVRASKPKSNPKFERQLDPREELMIAIRGFHGREKLRSVPAKETKWIHSNRLKDTFQESVAYD